MKRNNSAFCALAAFAVVFTAGADSLYVDCNGSKDYSTIQAAVDAAQDGDTVWVLPGVYDAGGYVDANGYTNRVYINKSIRLVATSSNPDDTHIVGARDTTPSGDAQGRGPAAVRGIYVPNTEAAAGIVVQGFTIRDCSSPSTGTESESAGGYAGAVTIVSKTARNCWVVDCVFKNNCGKRGAHAYGGYLLRCRLEDGYGTETVNYSQCLQCLFIDGPATGSGQDYAGAGGNYLIYSGAFYNCTFFNCRNNYVAQGLHTIYNCLFAGPANTFTYSAGKVTLTHSVLSRLRADNKNAIGSVDESHLTMVDSSFVDSNMQFFAPAFNDCRLLPTSAAIDAGAASHISDLLATVTPPEGVDVWKDYNWHDVPKTGAINAGCCQGVVTPTAGAVFATGADFFVDGHKVTLTKYFFPETYPTQFHATVSLPEGEGLFCYLLKYADGQAEIRRFPMPDDTLWFMPGSDASIALTCTVQKASSVKYAKRGADAATATGDAEHPFPTLQQAVDASSQDGLVIAAAGDYNEGGGVDGGLSNRVVFTKKVRLLGAGAGRSVIWGRPDDLSRDYGLGTNAVRCVSGSSTTYGCVQGFTLMNGYGGKSAGGNETMDRGGAVYSGASFVVADCLITNCVAYRGGASRGAAVVRCRVTCSGYKDRARLFEDSVVVKGSVLYNVNGADCTGFDVGYPALISDTTAIQSTILGHGGQYTLASGHSTKNCVVSGGTKPSSSWAFTNVGLVVPNGFGMPSADKTGKEQDFTVCEIRYANPAAADCRLMATSEAFGKGVYESDMYRWYEPVMDGPLLFVDGKPTPGAYQRPVPVLVAPKSIAWGTMSHSGTNTVDEGESVTVSISGSTRPVEGFLVDGEMHEGWSFVYTAPTFGAYGEASIAQLTPVFSTNWYVNAAKVDDSGDGFTPETAKKTLAGIMGCNILSGDCIHAAPGDYNEGSMKHNVALSIASRVVIPEGVTLVSDEGQDVTFITGASATTENLDGEADGTGSDAVRCVYMNGGVLRGFTLRGGRTKGNNDSTSVDCYGGGIVAKTVSVIEDCIITNCLSRRGGYITGGKYYRCRIGNGVSGVSDWFDYRLSGFYNCSIDVAETLSTDVPFVNCILRNTANYGRVYKSVASILALTNCVIVGDIRNTSAESDGAFVPANPNNIVCTGFNGTETTIDKSQFIKVAASDIAAAYDTTTFRFKGVKTSLFTDKGVDIDGLAVAGDIDGGQRVYNGKIDIGPNEYDWRSDFAGMIGGASVLKASPEVTTNVLGKMRIPDGGALELSVASKDARKLAFSVSGGELSATGGLEDETFTADGFYRLSPPATLSLVFSGENGYADIGEVVNKPGAVFVIR